MRFMVLVKANEDSENGVLPTAEQLAEMGAFNEEMVKAGMMLAAEGLQASSKGTRIKFSQGKPSIVDGPFAETKELVAGFWLIQAKSKDEAVAWLSRAPGRRSRDPSGVRSGRFRTGDESAGSRPTSAPARATLELARTRG
jgi:hypothetical protein